MKTLERPSDLNIAPSDIAPKPQGTTVTKESHIPITDHKIGSGNESISAGPTAKAPANGFWSSLIKGIFYPVFLIAPIVACGFGYGLCTIGDAMLVHFKKKRGESAIQEHHHSKLLQSWAASCKSGFETLASTAFVNTWVSAVRNVCNFASPAYDNQGDIPAQAPKSKFLMGDDDNEINESIVTSGASSSRCSTSGTSPIHPHSASTVATPMPPIMSH
jgi:hypothetical protein